jgi:hypothetical protein
VWSLGAKPIEILTALPSIIVFVLPHRGQVRTASAPENNDPLQPVAQLARSLPFCVVRNFVHVAIDTHSHGAPGVFR